jgi:hypothetical protein
MVGMLILCLVIDCYFFENRDNVSFNLVLIRTKAGDFLKNSNEKKINRQ